MLGWLTTYWDARALKMSPWLLTGQERPSTAGEPWRDSWTISRCPGSCSEMGHYNRNQVLSESNIQLIISLKGIRLLFSSPSLDYFFLHLFQLAPSDMTQFYCLYPCRGTGEPCFYRSVCVLIVISWRRSTRHVKFELAMTLFSLCVPQVFAGIAFSFYKWIH